MRRRARIGSVTPLGPWLGRFWQPGHRPRARGDSGERSASDCRDGDLGATGNCSAPPHSTARKLPGSRPIARETLAHGRHAARAGRVPGPDRHHHAQVSTVSPKRRSGRSVGHQEPRCRGHPTGSRDPNKNKAADGRFAQVGPSGAERLALRPFVVCSRRRRRCLTRRSR
jgi:hypothetical protein